MSSQFRGSKFSYKEYFENFPSTKLTWSRVMLFIKSIWAVPQIFMRLKAYIPYPLFLSLSGSYFVFMSFEIGRFLQSQLAWILIYHIIKEKRAKEKPVVREIRDFTTPLKRPFKRAHPPTPDRINLTPTGKDMVSLILYLKVIYTFLIIEFKILSWPI